MVFNKKFSHVPVKVPPVKSAYRQIKTSIPVPESIQHLEYGYNLESRSMHGQFPIIWDRAEGFQVHDRCSHESEASSDQARAPAA